MVAFLFANATVCAQNEIRRTGWKPRASNAQDDVPRPILHDYVPPKSGTASQKPAKGPALQAPSTPIRRAVRTTPRTLRRDGYAKPVSLQQQQAADAAQDDLSDLERDAASQQNRSQQKRETLTDLALQSRDIREIRPFMSFALEGIDPSELPEKKVQVTKQAYVPPTRPAVAFHWMASNLHHNPLYFEDPSLERYGHTYHPMVQPFVSAGRFTTQLIGLPYQMAIDPVHKRQYTLGWLRPGDCAPKKHYQIPLNKRAAMVEAGFLTGAFFAFP